jgi:hypothetical protein
MERFEMACVKNARHFRFWGKLSLVSLSLAEQILLSAWLPTEASRMRLRHLLTEHADRLDWSALLARAEASYAVPLLRYNLAQCGLLVGLPEAVQGQLETSCQTWAARHLAYVHEAERLCGALFAAGITAIPLKGAALMLGGYYPQAGLRPAVDLDLLVEQLRITEAERVAQNCGYEVLPGRTLARPRQRLANELNHTAVRRGPNGLLLELHTRAFHHVRTARDFGFAEINARAQAVTSAPIHLPASADLALHLMHHTLVDLQSTPAILRTLADLHFILWRDSGAKEALLELGRTFGLSGTISSALQAQQLLATGDVTELERAFQRRDGCALLLETALLEEPLALADAARLFEYFDLSRAPLRRLGNLFSLLLTNRAHLAQLYGEPAYRNPTLHYLRRPYDLLRKFNWASLQPSTLRRVRRLRKLASQR